MDRGNKDQSPHKKVRSNHDLDFRKNRLLLTSFFTLVPAVLFIVFWGDREDIDRWEISVLTAGAGCIILGCIEIMLFELINKDTRSMNIFGTLLCALGGILYLIGAIGIAEDLGDHNNKFFSNTDGNVVNTIGNRNRPTHRESIYWFGLISLIGLDALILAMDCAADLFFSQYLRISLWAFPLTFSTWFAFGYLLYFGRNRLSWWEITGKAGFGTVAIATLLIIILSCMRVLIKSVGTFLAFCSFLGSVLIWIYHGAYIKKYVDDASSACFYIGIPFLISAQSLFLLYDCLLGTKEPKDGAAANTVHHPHPHPENQNNHNRDVRVPVDARDDHL